MEGKQVIASFTSVIEVLKQRLDDNSNKDDRSNMEFFVLNLYLFNRISIERKYYATFAENRDREKIKAERENQIKQEELNLRAEKTQGFSRVDKKLTGVQHHATEGINGIELSETNVVNNQLHNNIHM